MTKVRHPKGIKEKKKAAGGEGRDVWQVTKEHFLKAREKTAWSTYILRAHGLREKPLIQMIREKKKGGGETSDVKCYPIKLKINSPER